MMPVAPPPLPSCPTCEGVLDANGACLRCRAALEWQDQIEALDFVVRRFQDWHKDGQLTDRQLKSLSDRWDERRRAMVAAAEAKQPFHRDAALPPNDECWSCQEYLYTPTSHCERCGAPLTLPGVRSLRCWRYVQGELAQLEESGILALRQAHEFQSDAQERIAALQRKLERERALMVLPVEDEPQPRRRRRDDEEPREPRRSVLEILLDPQSIQWLFAAGGALIVLGLVIWLTSLGLFDNPGFVAVALGLGNAALLAGGWALILRSRYQSAGRALTLLACLVMPLNLWFYHTHGLITVEGNLWLAALVCCVLYTASALVLKDALFVYVLVGGVTLTGLLILAQMHRFGEIIAPTTMLIALGLICLHAERAFPVSDGPFARRRFGMAFFWSSQALFASGLLLLLGAQFVGMAFQPIFRMQPPDVATRAYLPWTLCLVLAGTYAYIYSDLVVRRIGVYLYLAAITILWAEIHVFILFDVVDNPAVVIIDLALTALAINVLSSILGPKYEFLRVIPPLGLLLSILPVAYGLLLHFRATNIVLHEIAPFEITWGFVGAMAVTALVCRAGANFYRHSMAPVSIAYFFVTAAATLVFAAGLAWMIGVKPWEEQAPLVMLVPILYLIAAHLYQDHTPATPLVWAAHVATAVMLLHSTWVALGIMPQIREIVPVEGKTLNLLLAVYCLEGAFFYCLATFVRRTNWTVYLAIVMLSGAIWQFLRFFNTPREIDTLVFAVTGFVLLLLYRLGAFEAWEMPALERALFQSANVLTTLGFVSGALLSLGRLFMAEDAAGAWRHPVLNALFLLIFLSIVSALSAWMVQHQAWRRVHIVLAIVNVLLVVLMIHKLSSLNPWQRLEIFSIVIGVVLLIAGHVGWYRETERASDLVSMALVFGSLAVAGPLLLASAIHRFGLTISELDEAGLVGACVILFATGVMCRIRATTIIGALTMLLYVLMVLIYMHRFLKETVIVGIYLTLGGVLIFSIALFLSVYRDRLMSLPGRMRRREGIFRIFDWR
jgi:hypothetical protein